MQFNNITFSTKKKQEIKILISLEIIHNNSGNKNANVV